MITCEWIFFFEEQGISSIIFGWKLGKMHWLVWFVTIKDSFWLVGPFLLWSINWMFFPIFFFLFHLSNTLSFSSFRSLRVIFLEQTNRLKNFFYSGWKAITSAEARLRGLGPVKFKLNGNAVSKFSNFFYARGAREESPFIIDIDWKNS